jgi:DNA-binding response OmpR family regulator
MKVPCEKADRIFARGIREEKVLMQNNQYTLTLDDDMMVHPIIEASLGLANHSFLSVEAFLVQAENYAPVGVFVDIHLGKDESGLTLIPTIRGWWPHTPIFVVTSDQSDEAIGQALIAGANDFIRKPLNSKELVARFQARSMEMADKAGRELLRFGDVMVDLRLNRIFNNKAERHLSHADMLLLKHLVLSHGTIVTRDELKRFVWGDVKVTDNALDKKLYEVRQAIKEVTNTIKIESAYGKGIRIKLFKAEENTAA